MAPESSASSSEQQRARARPGFWRRARRWPLGLAALVWLLDQISKYWMERLLLTLPQQGMALLPGVNLVLVHNPGAAFSLLSEAGGWQRWFFIALTLVIIAVLWQWLRAAPAGTLRLPCALALILGGALGNLTDRILRAHVVDFIDVYYRQWHWPAFNVADAAITLGAILLLVDMLRPSRRRS